MGRMGPYAEATEAGHPGARLPWLRDVLPPLSFLKMLQNLRLHLPCLRRDKAGGCLDL